MNRQAYHGNVFVGNHCKKILQNFDTLCSVLDGTPHEKAFRQIFEVLAAPRDLLFAKRFLNEDEITRVCKQCEEFCEIYPILFPHKKITPKMHFYSFDVPRFLKKHKTIGLLSEEEGESLHAAINQQNRVLACIRDPATRMYTSLKRHFVRGQSNKDLVQPRKRNFRT